uniref:bL24m n=1 Tax=Polytomella magna TaxID=353565 RepID=UPI002240E4D7|nr:Chain As, bL24m [Polytomella magna]8APN_As Chain As, bL24m [Polytomella magna]8APO_As Chain As, bL24m [Polytomella magna]
PLDIQVFREDTVRILNGPDKGLTGKVLEVFQDPKNPKIFVEGRNMRKKKIRMFVVISMEAPLDYKDVQLVDPATQEPGLLGPKDTSVELAQKVTYSDPSHNRFPLSVRDLFAMFP